MEGKHSSAEDDLWTLAGQKLPKLALAVHDATTLQKQAYKVQADKRRS